MNSTKNTIICIVVGVVSSILIFGMGFVNKTYEEPKKYIKSTWMEKN